MITNLAPRKMRGLDSHGMLLAASSDGGKPALATFLDSGYFAAWLAAKVAPTEGCSEVLGEGAFSGRSRTALSAMARLKRCSSETFILEVPFWSMLIDSHAHLDFYDDPAAVVARAQAAGRDADSCDWDRAMVRRRCTGRLSLRTGTRTSGHRPAFTAQEAQQATPEMLARLGELAGDPRCVAVGEIGLDYYHLANPDIATQQRAFVAQMEIAAGVRKPILIHCRTSELATPEAKGQVRGGRARLPT